MDDFVLFHATPAKGEWTSADKRNMEISAIALSGMQQAQTRLDKTATRIAAAADPSTPTDTADLSGNMVALLEARNAFAANAQTMRTADQIERNVLNILA
jgi:flagellar hook protein FlgE